jgi:hypothetical protein
MHAGERSINSLLRPCEHTAIVLRELTVSISSSIESSLPYTVTAFAFIIAISKSADIAQILFPLVTQVMVCMCLVLLGTPSFMFFCNSV